jgi:membrane protease YdiL (CAAX protease family)
VAAVYQGAGGVAGSAIVGFLFGLLFLLTGNLLLPIIFHGVMDLRMLAILRFAQLPINSPIGLTNSLEVWLWDHRLVALLSPPD